MTVEIRPVRDTQEDADLHSSAGEGRDTPDTRVACADASGSFGEGDPRPSAIDTHDRPVAPSEQPADQAHPDTQALRVRRLLSEIRDLHRIREDHHREEKSLILRCAAICRRHVAERIPQEEGVTDKQWLKAVRDKAGPLLKHLYGIYATAHLPTAGLSDAKRKTALRKIAQAHVEQERLPAEQKNLLVYLSLFFDARQRFESYRKEIEKQMAPLARQLPVWAWAEGIPGVNVVSLCQIVAEAMGKEFRTPADYRNPSALWTRFGVGRFQKPDGAWSRQRRFSDKETAIVAQYSPRRRSLVFVLAENILKAQRSNKTHPLVVAYYERRARTAVTHGPESAEPWKKAHAHKDALRYIGKQFLRGLWREWRSIDAASPFSSSIATPSPCSPACRGRGQPDDPEVRAEASR